MLSQIVRAIPAFRDIGVVNGHRKHLEPSNISVHPLESCLYFQKGTFSVACTRFAIQLCEARDLHPYHQHVEPSRLF